MKFIYSIFILLFLPGTSFGNYYTTQDGYEVELYWKVKHRKELIVFGSVQKGEKCNQLELHIGMRHKSGWYQNFYANFSKPHTESSRSTFKLEENFYSKSIPDKGWYPDSISVYCKSFSRK